jgi:DNA-binding transcriptional regulator YiaG
MPASLSPIHIATVVKTSKREISAWENKAIKLG